MPLILKFVVTNKKGLITIDYLDPSTNKYKITDPMSYADAIKFIKDFF